MRPGAAPEGSDSDTEVAELSLRLRHCRVTVRVQSDSAPAPPLSSSGSFSVVGEEPRAGVPLDGRWAHLERHRPILDLTSPADLAAWDIGVHSALARGLGSASSGWTARARVGRAFRAGVGAALVIEGAETHQPRSPDISSRSRFFVCLRAPGYPDGFWTSEAARFFRLVAGERGQRFHPEVVCHAFPSRAEVGAFLAGADQAWPAELHRER